jgi:erythrocyte band 7 integral membrane protein
MGTDHSASSGKVPLNNGNLGALHEASMQSQSPYRADLQPSYAKVWKPDQEDAKSHGWYAAMIEGLGTVIGTCGAIPCCVVCPNPYRPVQQGTVGLITKFGRFARAVDPGLVRVNPLSEKLVAIDVKMQIVGINTSTL